MGWGGRAPPMSQPSHGVTWDSGGMRPDQRLLNLPHLIDLEWGECLKIQISRLFLWILTPPIWCSTSKFALLRSPHGILLLTRWWIWDPSLDMSSVAGLAQGRNRRGSWGRVGAPRGLLKFPRLQVHLGSKLPQPLLCSGVHAPSQPHPQGASGNPQGCLHLAWAFSTSLDLLLPDPSSWMAWSQTYPFSSCLLDTLFLCLFTYCLHLYFHSLHDLVNWCLW